MILEDLKKIGTYQTRAIAEVISRDEATLNYVLNCLNRFYNGDFGEVPEEDTAANMKELEDGEGRALGHYKAAEKLEGDIYINCYFSASNPNDIDYNNLMIMYCNEY